MDPWAIIAIAATIAFVIAAIAQRRTQHHIARLREVTGVGADGDPAFGVQELRAANTRLEREVADQVEDRRQLADLIDVAVVDVDARLEVVFANAAAHALVDRPPGTLPGLSVLAVFLDPQIDALARAALEQGSASGEVRLPGNDGPTLIVRARRSTSGGVSLALADVSELRRLQQIRTEFIDNLSHELRTPITTVGLLAETLRREADAAGEAIPPKMRDRIGTIEVETGHLVQIVSEIMDLSRIESGSGLTLIDDLDLGGLAAASVERLTLFADRQGVRLRADVPSGLPRIRGDEARLGQVFVNLVHNAVKFSPGGSEVVVAVRLGDRELVSSVQDHGIGIPRAAQRRIFERFYKVDQARVRGDTPGGTGLGLAISRHIVEQHGGRIWLESSEGNGSTFSFALPLGSEGG